MYLENPKAGVFRRFAAIMYDLLALIALWMLAMAIGLAVVAILAKTQLISLEGYQDHADYIQHHALWFQLYSLLVFGWFYLYFWVKAGQTLGMRAWRMLLIRQDGAKLTYRQAAIRLLTSLFGLGNFWLWLKPTAGLALQDKLSHTQVVVLTKEQSQQFNLHDHAR